MNQPAAAPQPTTGARPNAGPPTVKKSRLAGWVVIGVSTFLLVVILVDSLFPSQPAEPEPLWPTVTVEIMRRADVDKDGRVSAAEYSRLDSEGSVADWDVNADGSLSPYEVERSFTTADPIANLAGRLPAREKTNWGF